MQNIELKVRHPDLARVRTAAAALGARYTWTRTQRDTYYAVRSARLKVREMPDRAELIWYQRPDGTSPRPSHYTLQPLRDAAAARALLAALYPPAGVVEKVRELWLWRNVRVHLDTVQGLGTFVELEGVVGPDVDEAASRAHVDTAIAALALDRCAPVPQSYGDLVVRG